MQLPARLDFRCPVKLLHGRCALEHIPYELEMLNACNPLLLSDAVHLNENRGQALSNALRDADMRWGVADSLPAEWRPGLVQALAAIYRDRDHDALMVMGGASLMDLAKLVNVAVSTGHDDPAVWTDGHKIEQPLKPMVLIAQAGASGYESSGWVRTGQVGLRSIHLMPDLAVVDERTVGSPNPHAVIDNGLVALAIGAENLMDAAYNPMAAIYATNAVYSAMVALRSIANLPVEAALYMHAANAAVMAGCTLGDGTPGKLLRLGYHLAETHRISFPAALAVLMPAAAGILLPNRDRIAENLLTALLGLDRSACTPRHQRPMRVTATLAALVNDLFDFSEGYIPRTLLEAGFAPEELHLLAESYVQTVEEAEFDLTKTILQNALNGDL